MRRFHRLIGAAAFPLSLGILSTPAFAAPEIAGDADGLQIQPILDARARYETVEQGAYDADALTFRMRIGAETTLARLSLLAEAEGTVAPVDNYNAFPFPLPNESQWRPQHAIVADPENAELNRLQLQYKLDEGAVTFGRQRINLDDQRWVGSVGWRQNEQTFDAARGEARLGLVGVDLIYAIAQRAVFGEDAGSRTSLNGDFLLAGLSSSLGSIQGKLFSYLLDYDEGFFLANSSQTYGGIVSGSIAVAREKKVSFRASYARQSDYGGNPFDYAADYWVFEGATAIADFTVTAGWEQLGSDNGRAVQTPLATLHKFNGWADLFLTTPPAGLEDAYVTISKKFDGVKLLPGLNASIIFHQFDSAAGDVEYGTEWDASVGFQAAGLGWLLKFTDYDATEFGADTRKLWLQAEWAL